MTGPIDEHTPPSDVDEDSIGRKGYELVRLADHAACGAFRVPRFRIVTTALSLGFHATHGYPDPAWPDLPAAHDIPTDVTRHYGAFAALYAGDLARVIAGFDGGRPVVLRSSVAAPVPPEASMAGVSFNVHGVPPQPDRVAAACTRLLAAAWRPYADWYLARHRVGTARHTAFLVCQLIDLTVAGTAYLAGGVAHVDFGRAAPSMPVRSMSIALTGPEHGGDGWWGHRGRAQRLRVALAELAARVDPGPAPVEVEFGFDADDRLYFFQYRIMTALAPDGRGLPLRHSVGSVRGPLVSLLDQPRRTAVAERAVGGSGEDRIWVVRQVDDTTWDAFALLWFMSQRRPGDSVRIVSCFDDLPRRTHLLAAMHEDPVVQFVAQLPTSAVIPLLRADGATVRSDGIAASITQTHLDGVRR